MDHNPMAMTQEIIVEPPADGQMVDPMRWFETPGPFELEIGCGKGGFLLHRAMRNPQIRMLGIEWANKFFKHCAERMARRGVTNVRVMRTDAKFFVMNHLPAECVSVLHLYHPDPWPKKRHRKRRLVQEPFVAAAVRALVRGGQWLIQSDHAEYFEQMQRLIGGHAEMREIAWEESAAPMIRPPEVESEESAGEEVERMAARERVSTDPAVDWKGTNFEIKYAREGRAIYRVAFARNRA